MSLIRRAKKPDAQQVTQAFYDALRQEVASGDLLFELHEDFPFTRPGLPIRRWQELDAQQEVPRGSAIRAAGNIAVTAATLVDEAGRRQEPTPRELKAIGSHMIALEILSDELDGLNSEEEVIRMSASDMSQKIADQYADYSALPPDHIVTLEEGGDKVELTAALVQGGISILQEKLISEAV